MASMILTGDVNLMHVEDAAIPFARVQESLRAADIVFSNLECCLYDPPDGQAAETEGFFASPLIAGGRSSSRSASKLLRRRARTARQRSGSCEPRRDDLLTSLHKM